jgi:hypothetical protein
MDISHREQAGFCDMYSMVVLANRVCDEWYADRAIQKPAEDAENSPSK